MLPFLSTSNSNIAFYAEIFYCILYTKLQPVTVGETNFATYRTSGVMASIDIKLTPLNANDKIPC